MDFLTFLFQQQEFTSALLKLIIYLIACAVTIFVNILIAKYLIRYGVNYFFKMKEYHDGRNAIDEIQQDIIKKHPREDEP